MPLVRLPVWKGEYDNNDVEVLNSEWSVINTDDETIRILPTKQESHENEGFTAAFPMTIFTSRAQFYIPLTYEQLALALRIQDPFSELILANEVDASVMEYLEGTTDPVAAREVLQEAIQQLATLEEV